MTTLFVNDGMHDYSADDLTGTNIIDFTGSSAAFAIFNAAQFGSQISNSLLIGGNGLANEIYVGMSELVVFSAQNWVFVDPVGGSLKLSVVGWSGDDVIIGQDGDNTIVGYGGADTLIGGRSHDVFEYRLASDAVAGEFVDGGEGEDVIEVSYGVAGHIDFSSVTLHNVEILSLLSFQPAPVTVTVSAEQIGAGSIETVYGSGNSSYALVVTGSAVNLSTVTFEEWDDAANTITIRGTDAANTLIGSNRPDIFHSIAGANDFMRGGAGGDTYYIDTAADTVDESFPGSGGRDTVIASLSISLADSIHAAGNIENLTLTSTADIDGEGNSLANVIVGNSGRNILRGRGGEDRLSGGNDSDTLIGGLRDDNLIGGNGRDALAGGSGKDLLRGGAGDDFFRFDTALDALTNVDHIADFLHLHDKFQLMHTIFDSIAAGPLATGAFHLGTATAAGNRIIYDQPTGRLYYDDDGSGAHARTLFAILDNHAVLTAADFVIVA